MCRTPEEAAWTVMTGGLEKDHPIIAALLDQYGKQYLRCDFVRNASRKGTFVKAICEFWVSDEALEEARREHSAAVVD